MKTLRRRLVLTHTLVALLAVLLVALLASGLILRAYRELIRQQNRNIQNRLGMALIDYHRQNRGWADVDQVLAEGLAERTLLEARRVVLADRRGQVRFDSAGILAGRQLPLRLRNLGMPLHPPRRSPDGARPPPVGYLAVLPDLGSESDAFTRSIMRMVLLGSGVAGGVAFVVALLIARRVTRPLRRLTHAAQRLATGARHEPLPIPAEVELAELSRAFNRMAAELARQEDLRRQFVADVAHELRTPLSVLRLQAEGLEDGVEEPTPALFASLREEVDLLTRLVEDLRLLSLADAGMLTFAGESLDACAMLERAVAVAAPRARQQGITLHVACPENRPHLLADPQRLLQILGNLLENALRYTPRNGSVTLRAFPAGQHGTAPGEHVVIEVADTGPGIAAEDLPHIFDRFYRTDRARARETGGSGLGLAIVQRLVEAQNGQVSVSSTPGKGTTFCLQLPAAPDVVVAQ
jgi:signal transduction histidine kinase